MTHKLKMLLVGLPSLHCGRKHLMKMAFTAILGLLLFAAPASAVVIISGSATAPIDTSAGAGTYGFNYTLQGFGNVLVFGTYVDNNYTASNVLFNGVAADGFIQDGRSFLAYIYDPNDSVSISFDTTAGNANGGYYLYELNYVDTTASADLGTTASITTSSNNRFVVDFVGNNFSDGNGLAPAGSSILTSYTVTNFNGAIGGGALGSGTGVAGAAGSQTLGWVAGPGGSLTGEVSAAFVPLAGGPVPWNVNGGGSWNTGANWFGGSAPSPSGQALFGDVLTAANAPATITLDSPVSIGTINFSNTNSYEIAGPSTLTLTGAATLAVGIGSHEVSANIAGTAGLTKSGGGALTLTGSNTYSGTTTITGGSLHVTQTGAIPGAVSIEAAGELRFMGDGGGGGYSGVFSNALSGSGNLWLDTSLTTETVTRSTSSTIGGQIEIDGGTLAISNASALGTGDGTPATQTRVNEFGGTGTGKLALSGNINVSSELLILGPRRGVAANYVHVTSAGNNTWGGNIQGDANGDNYNFESTSGTLTLSGTLSAPDGGAGIRNFVFSGAGNFNVTDRITDFSTNANGEQDLVSLDTEVNVHVYKQGSGTLTIGTASSDPDLYWHGDTVIEGGTLEVISDGSNNGELRSRSIDIRSGAILDVDHFGTYSLQVGQSLSGGGAVLATGKTLAIFDDNIVSPGDSVGTLTITGNASLSDLGGGGGVLSFELGDDPSTVGGAENDLISISGGFTTSGTPSMTVSVTPADGQLTAGTYRLISYTGPAVNVTGLSAQFLDEFGNPLTARQSLGVSSAANQVNLDVTGSSKNLKWTGANGTAWDKNTTANWNDGVGADVFFDIDQVTFDDSADPNNTTVNISGADVYPSVATFDSATGNTYTVTGTNGFGGTTPINLTGDVTAVLANTNTLQGNINIGANATLNIAGGGGASTVTGNISGSGTLVIGGGYNPFQSANSLTGPIVINAGTLTMSNANALGTTDSGTTVNANGTLDFNFQQLSITEPLTFNGGTLRCNESTVTVAGPTTVNAGGVTYQIGSTNGGTQTTTISGNIAGTASGPVVANVSTGVTLSVTGNITNNGVLRKTGTGTLILGASTTIGASEIAANGGSLDVTAKSALTLASGQALSGKDGTVTGNVTAASGSTVRVGDAVLPQGPDATYIDATWGTGGNTTFVGGGELNPPAGGFQGNDEWAFRTFGNNLDQLQGAPTNPPDPGAVPEIMTTISGLTPNTPYDVYANFWDDGGAVWPIQASADADPNSLTLFKSPADTLANATDATTLDNFKFTSTIGLVKIVDQTRTMYGAQLGSIMSDPNGRIEVFIDDTGAGPNGRTLYDGVTYISGSTHPFGQSFTIDGDLTLASSSTIQFDIADPGVNDLLDVSGNFTVSDGFVLQVSLDSSVAASSLVDGDSWDLLDFGSASGTFDAMDFDLPSLGAYQAWDTSQLLVDGTLSITMATPQPGDFDLDGDVDGDDFLLWQRNPGIGNLADWEGNYGYKWSPIVAASTASSTAVPEPGTAVLLLVGVFASASAARRRRSF